MCNAIQILQSILSVLYIDSSLLFCIALNIDSSSNYCYNSDSCRSFSILKAIAKSKEKLIAIIFKSKKEHATTITIEREIKERSSYIIVKIKQRRLRAITLEG